MAYLFSNKINFLYSANMESILVTNQRSNIQLSSYRHCNFDLVTTVGKAESVMSARCFLTHIWSLWWASPAVTSPGTTVRWPRSLHTDPPLLCFCGRVHPKHRILLSWSVAEVLFCRPPLGGAVGSLLEDVALKTFALVAGSWSCGSLKKHNSSPPDSFTNLLWCDAIFFEKYCHRGPKTEDYLPSNRVVT